MVISDDEWARRILCSDGNCIGVVGDDGLCNVCGKPFEGDLPLPQADSASITEEAVDEPEDRQKIEADTPPENHPPVGGETEDDTWEDRILCIDESCIGVVGPDGRCKECGKPYPG